MAGNVTAVTAAASTVVAPPSPAIVTAGVTPTTDAVDKVSVKVPHSLSPVEAEKTESSKTQTSSSETKSNGETETTENLSTTRKAVNNKVSVKSSQLSPTATGPTEVVNRSPSRLSPSRVVLTEKSNILGPIAPESFAVKVSSSQFGLPPIAQKRKFSFPAALHANLLGLSSNNSENLATTNASTRRRFSNVGDVVSRKLSNTIGWRTLPVPPQEVVAQGKALCCQYIRNRLKRSGIFNKKLGLYRLRSVVGTPSGMIVTEVYPSLVTAGQELERMHPKVFSNIARQASSTPAGVIVSDKAAASLLLAIGRELTKTDITWGKVVAIFAVAGGLAVDCVCQGHPEYLHGLVEGVTDLLEEELAEWIAANGGWTSLAAQCRSPTPEVTTSAYLSIFSIFILIVFIIYLIFKFFYRLFF